MSESNSGPNAANLGELMQAAQRVQQELARVQGELAKRSVEGSSGGGLVQATVNGRQQLLALRIDPVIVDPKELGMLQDLLVAAVNQALQKAGELAQQELSRVTGGALLSKIPGLL